MAERIEKQLVTIESLIKDKEALQSKVEKMTSEQKEMMTKTEKALNETAERFKQQLKREKEAWIASEKVRKEKWEADKIREIREGTVQKLEPTI